MVRSTSARIYKIVMINANTFFFFFDVRQFVRIFSCVTSCLRMLLFRVVFLAFKEKLFLENFLASLCACELKFLLFRVVFLALKEKLFSE